MPDATVAEWSGLRLDEVEKVDASNADELETLLRQMPRVDKHITAKDAATLEQMLAEPEPLMIRGQEFWQVFMSIKRMSRFVRVYREFAVRVDDLDEEAFMIAVGELGAQFLYKRVSPTELRPATSDEITEWFTPSEFISTVRAYLDTAGWTIQGEAVAGVIPTGDTSSPA